MFTKQDCPKCEWNEAYFERLAIEFENDDFVFGKMDLDKNYPTSELREFLYTKEDEPMLQFLAVLPDGGTVNRFQKEGDTYEELKKFIESAKYLVKLYRGDEPVKQEISDSLSIENNSTETDAPAANDEL